MTGVGKGKGRTFRGGIAAAAAAAAMVALPAAASADEGANCQPYLDDKPCLQPFPDDLYTKKAKTPTGRRVNLPAGAMPVNQDGIPVSPREWNRNDGFSPGSMITVYVPGLNTPEALANTKPAPLANLKKYKRAAAPIVVIDQKTGKRHPIWAELDSNASSPESTNLLIHPAINFKQNRRYAVALRNLKDAAGAGIKAPKWFRLLRDRAKKRKLPRELRKQHKRYKNIFRTLRKAGIKRNKKLYAAWNFTVISRVNLTSRLLQIRDDAFAQLGDPDLADGQVQGASPKFEVTSVENDAPISDNNPDSDPRVLRIVRGTVEVACYLVEDGCPPGSEFNYDSTRKDALPVQRPGNVAKAPFACVIPKAAANAPARASLYGHGLLGSANEAVNAGNVRDMAQEHNFVFCGTDSWGMSTEDIPYDITALQDLNRIPAVFDRLQQSALNTQFLGRAMIHIGGFTSDPAFRVNTNPVLDTDHLYYDGNSQGGITGGMNVAIAPDVRRGVLGVPGMNYGGMLLQRSSDFPPYALFLYGASGVGGYTDDSLHPLVLTLASQLWDRGETNGYVRQMTSRALPNTPTHEVLMHVAYGDFQVSQYSAAVEARTIGASAYKPALDLPAREQDVNLLWKVPRMQSFPFDGSAIVIWDSGPGFNTPPPLTNTAPEEPRNGTDPHGAPRSTVAARQQKSEFLKPAGRVVDVCNGLPCHSDNYVP